MKQLRFVNRQHEMSYLKRYFQGIPNALLFVFGPKSSGKSVLLREIIKDAEMKDLVFIYYDLRKSGISNYYDFVDFFMKESRDGIVRYDPGLYLSVCGFGVTKKKKQELKEIKKLNDVFGIFLEEIQEVRMNGKMPVIIIDELQQLREIYTNGGGAILDYLFNFFVTIT